MVEMRRLIVKLQLSTFNLHQTGFEHPVFCVISSKLLRGFTANGGLSNISLARKSRLSTEVLYLEGFALKEVKASRFPESVVLISIIDARKSLPLPWKLRHCLQVNSFWTQRWSIQVHNSLPNSTKRNVLNHKWHNPFVSWKLFDEKVHVVTK